MRALEKDRDDRYATAQALADDLRRFLDDQPIRPKRPSLTARSVKWSRRHKSIVQFGFAALCLVTVGLAVNTLMIKGEQSRTATALHESQANLREAQTQ